jgi:hypothetical protein
LFNQCPGFRSESSFLTIRIGNLISGEILLKGGCFRLGSRRGEANRSQETDNTEAFTFRGVREIAIGSNEDPAARPIVAPDQSGAQLERIGCPELVAVQQSFGPMPDIVSGLDLVPKSPEVFKALERLPAFTGRHVPIAFQSIQ